MKKKINRLLIFSVFAVVCSLFLINTVDATIVNISAKVPAFQKYGYVAQAEKGSRGSIASVYLWIKQNEAVTFTVRGVEDNEYGKGVVVEHTDLLNTLYYSKVYEKGTQVQARYRNHNWTANSGQIDGYFDYD